MKQTLNNALTALDAGNAELARAYILTALNNHDHQPCLLTRKRAARLAMLEPRLAEQADNLHAMLASKPNGISLYDCKRDIRFSILQSLVRLRAVAILERHNFAIIRNLTGKGERLISTRF